jgi:MFS family permease
MKNTTTTNARAVAAGLGATLVWRAHADDEFVQFPTKPSVIIELLPLMSTVLVAFLVIGAALPVLPLFVHDVLGFGPAMVGVVAGCQFTAALIARIWSGQAADRKGAKWAVMAGLAGAALAGLLYLCAFSLLGLPRVSIAILLAGRAMLGGAESFIITGATAWGLARAGAHNAGKVIAWMGTAMFAAFAAGAPIGTAIYEKGGFGAVSAATTIAPLVTFILIVPLRRAVPAQRRGPGILSVVSKIWVPGLGAALSSVGFGAIAAFGSLLFADHGWTPVWLVFSTYALSLIVARLAFGHLPDQIGGARVALLFSLIEVAGLALMSFASAASVAAIGAALTGFGYSLVFPALGVEAVRRAPAEGRGVAMGAYTACLDIALGVSGPVLGLMASRAGLSAVFLVSALVVLGAVPVALRLLRANRES